MGTVGTWDPILRVITRKMLLLLLPVLLLSGPGHGSSLGNSTYIHHVWGDIPLIISVPHGGRAKPDHYPDRHDGCHDTGSCVWPAPSGCNSHKGCEIVTTSDKDTQDLAQDIKDALYDMRGVTPHMVITDLHRIKLDPNRLKGEATGGSSVAEYAYNIYHHYLKASKDAIVAEGPGLLIQLHGQGHHQNSTELGYRITTDNLNAGTGQMKDCSMRALGERTGMSLDELLSGPSSFGALMEQTGFNAVPSDRQPAPHGDKYFDGGHITDYYGSSHGGILDAVQLECPSEVRWEGGPEMRKAFGKAVAEVLLSFLDLYYL